MFDSLDWLASLMWLRIVVQFNEIERAGQQPGWGGNEQTMAALVK